MNYVSSAFAMSSTPFGIFKTGGVYNNGSALVYLKFTEYYGENRQWEIGPDMPFSLFDHCQIYHKNKLYVFGKLFYFHVRIVKFDVRIVHVGVLDWH